ncbi:ABC transporter ATP-binding protein [Kushneria aurantia]|uniref:ABC transporter ATP-binding protein n=1 Tax=Kushneria aurantia TaxID=504092 RepID=A0ABV6G2K3_9GAMM|nr:sn-glycerol-3-phosphate ABC transporter ATP-binding protein UgpC [Kushneria aurantia]
MSGIELANVSKSFDTTEVIRGVSLTVDKGELGVFVGPSGCGKSTLLRMIAGLEETTSGRISIGDRDVTRIEPAEREVAMVFQSYALYPHLSVFDNMAFSLRLARASKAQTRDMVQEAARILQLEEHLDKKPAQLSGGQRQRVAIGRAIVRQPKVFLFDEPLSNLDAELRVQMRLELARLHRRIGATMIYVTHDQVEAMTLADRIFVLRNGMVQQQGAPLELYNDPDNRFIGGFIGSPAMNFLDGHVTAQNDAGIEVAVDGADGQRLHARLASKRVTGDRVTLGLRPEHLHPNADGLRVRMEMVEALGGVSYLHTRTPDGTELVVEYRGAQPPADSTGIAVGIDPANVVVFDSQGRRLR